MVILEEKWANGQVRDVEYEFGGHQIRIWGHVFRLFHCEYGEIQPQIFPYLQIRAVFGVPELQGTQMGPNGSPNAKGTA